MDSGPQSLFLFLLAGRPFQYCGFLFYRPQDPVAPGPDIPAMTRWVSGMCGSWDPISPVTPSSHTWSFPALLSPELSTTARGIAVPALPPTAVRSSLRHTKRMCASFMKVGVLGVYALLPACRPAVGERLSEEGTILQWPWGDNTRGHGEWAESQERRDLGDGPRPGGFLGQGGRPL